MGTSLSPAGLPRQDRTRDRGRGKQHPAHEGRLRDISHATPRHMIHFDMVNASTVQCHVEHSRVGWWSRLHWLPRPHSVLAHIGPAQCPPAHAALRSWSFHLQAPKHAYAIFVNNLDDVVRGGNNEPRPHLLNACAAYTVGPLGLMRWASTSQRLSMQVPATSPYPFS